MIKDILIRIFIGVGAAVLAGIISSILCIKYRLVINSCNMFHSGYYIKFHN